MDEALAHEALDGDPRPATTRPQMRGWRRLWQPFSDKPIAIASLVVLAIFAVVGIFAPWLAPFEPLEKHYYDDGKLMRLLTPSGEFPFGTTLYARDVFSQIIVGTRTALVVGVITALTMTILGLNIGLIAGYFGGWIDNVLMRITDIVFGVPILPFAIVALSLLDRNTWWIIALMAALFWPITARVVRSQVLSLRERPFIDAARISGAGHLRIIYKHIAPNVMPQAFVHGVFGVAWAITTEASINFLGFGDPFTISWGTIIYDVFASMVSFKAWWWFVPPGLCIIIVTTAFYFIGQAFEEVADPRLRER
jgi:peptide/nickel transport system permease protein